MGWRLEERECELTLAMLCELWEITELFSVLVLLCVKGT